VGLSVNLAFRFHFSSSSFFHHGCADSFSSFREGIYTCSPDFPLIISVCEWAKYSHTVVFCCECVLHFATCHQEYCLGCGKHLNAPLLRAHCRRCDSCRKRARNNLPSIPSSCPPPSSSPSSSLFDREPSSSQHLSEVERAAAVTLRKLGQTQAEAGVYLACSRKAVAHWEHTYKHTGQVHDRDRIGRPRKLTELEDSTIVMASTVQHFDTPRQLKRKLQLDVVSLRTIDRRLIESGLPGRVAQHERKFSEEDKRKRLSFAQGYKDWTEEQWDRVIFSDEKRFCGEGFCGRVWVRRPPRKALNPEYCVDKKPHPVKVNVWGCFSGRGLGYCYVFSEHLDGKLMKSILDEHLIPSAHLHYETEPPEQWWFLQDNDPKHKSRLVKDWIHNQGIHCLDFPPYSPDLNPIENLWNDLARRVETRQAETVEQLQDVVAEEWAATSTDLLVKLAHSMPKRCQAVIDAEGGHTKY
jgi:hypothetical protein